jgi:hypothetical protein
VAFSRRLVFRSLLATPLGAWLRPWLPSGGAGDGTAAPAEYQRAWAWTAQMSPGDRERIRVRSLLALPLDNELKRLVDRAAPALEAVRRGSAQRLCSWGDVGGPESLNKGPLDTVNVVDVGKLLLIRSRLHFEERRSAEGLDDAFAVARYGRHIGSVGLFISRLYQCGLENRTIEVVARYLPGLDPEGLARRRLLQGQMPPSLAWDETIRREWKFIRKTLDEQIDKAVPPIRVASLEEAEVEPATAAFLMTRAGGDRQKLHALVMESGMVFEELGKVLDLPRDRYKPVLTAFEERVRTANPLVHSVVESAEGVRWACARTELQWAMVWAGAVLVEGGPGRFRQLADPYGSGPFLQRARGRGFELESAVRREGQPPVVVRFGDVTG